MTTTNSNMRALMAPSTFQRDEPPTTPRLELQPTARPDAGACASPLRAVQPRRRDDFEAARAALSPYIAVTWRENDCQTGCAVAVAQERARASYRALLACGAPEPQARLGALNERLTAH